MRPVTSGWLSGMRIAPASAFCFGSANGAFAFSWPPRRKVLIRPPTRLPLASMTVTVCPAARSRWAAVSPAGPAPTISTFLGALRLRGRPLESRMSR